LLGVRTKEEKMATSPIIKRLATGYLCIGFAISFYQNTFGELTHGPVSSKEIFHFFSGGLSFLR
jgi:hypothetical protein